MKRMKRTGIYKASNVTFDPLTMTAYSYGWWRFVERIGGEIVFNGYNYSPSTCKHQSKVRKVLGYDRPMVFVQCPGGLQDLNSGIEYARRNIESLEAEIMRPGTRKAKNEERRERVLYWLDQIRVIESLIESKQGGELAA